MILEIMVFAYGLALISDVEPCPVCGSRFCGDRLHEVQPREGYGSVPGPVTGEGALRSAALATPGSWTQRNVLQSAAQGSWQRRISGNATEADFAVLRAARPGISSSRSGPIPAAWSHSPWIGEGNDDGEALSDAVVDEMGL